MKLTLNAMKRNPALLDRFAGKPVRIWSGQWRQWWLPHASGYTNDAARAGVYAFSDAWDRSSHCGPEKKIEYHTLGNRES